MLRYPKGIIQISFLIITFLLIGIRKGLVGETDGRYTTGYKDNYNSGCLSTIFGYLLIALGLCFGIGMVYLIATDS